jgi:hypothetical protein
MLEHGRAVDDSAQIALMILNPQSILPELRREGFAPVQAK